MVTFVNIASVMWLGTTSVSIYHIAICRDFQSHKEWMIRSVYYALVPVFQRVVNFVPLSILAMGWRLSADAVHCIPFYESRWGDDTGDWTRAFSLGSSRGNFTSRPLVLSFDGYGVAEHLVFSTSAWAGLVAAAFFAEVQCREMASSSTSWELVKSGVSKMVSVRNASATMPMWKKIMLSLAALAGAPLVLIGVLVLIVAPSIVAIFLPVICATFAVYLGSWLVSTYLGIEGTCHVR